MKLKIETKEGNQKEFESFAERIKIGRGVNNDIILKGSYVSRYHAEISVSDSECKIFDLDSKNGTFLNGRKLTQVKKLNINDIIKIGDFTLHCFDFKSIELDTVTVFSEKKPAKLNGLQGKSLPRQETETAFSNLPSGADIGNETILVTDAQNRQYDSEQEIEITESEETTTTSFDVSKHKIDEEPKTATAYLGQEQIKERSIKKDTVEKKPKEYSFNHTQEKYWLPKTSIISLLLKKGVLDETIHRNLLKDAITKRKSLDDAIIDNGILSRKKLHDLYKDELKLQILNEKEMLAAAQPKNLDRWLAEQYEFIPLEKKNGDLTLLTLNPLNAQALGDVAQFTGCRILPVVAGCSGKSEWQRWIKKAYDKPDSRVQEGRIRKGRDVQPKSSKDLSSIPADKLVDYIIDIALSERASDIHIEPAERGLVVRIRVDGVMEELLNIPHEDSSSIALEVTSQLKVRSKCNVAEKRLPQDSRFSAGAIDFRLSTLPIIYGEKTVLRILEKEALVPLEDLGMPYNDLEMLKRKITAPNGLILITGPTGSGKTTTLYSALDFLPSENLNIVTVEDPVEYRLSGVHQMHVKQNIGLTFAAGLRSILRQDPDVIMVGEIRDLETAEMAIQASLTGHVVFSTLHTNDAVGIVSRLMDMGIEPFLAASALTLGMAQRLVRKICENCKIPIFLNDLMSQLDREGITETRLKKNGIELGEDMEYMLGEGCPECKGSGYSGRQAVFEMIDITPDIRKIIVRKDFNEEMIRDVVEQTGMSTLLTSGLELIENGSTTIFELFRVIGEE